MENDTEHSSFRVISVPLSKPFYAKNARANQIIFVVAGFIFTPFGIGMITSSQYLLLGIIFIALGIGGFFGSIMIEFQLLFQTGDCPYCKKKIQMKYRETHFQCPLCHRPIAKTKSTVENAEPLILPNTTEPNISFDEMKVKFYETWNLQWQCTSEQRKRFERANNETIYCLREINPDNGTAKCQSSDYYTNNVIYDVTYHSCTCPDYKKRLYPCKHIYALTLNLGIMQPETDLSGIPQDIREKIEALPPDSLKSLKNIIQQNNFNAFLLKKTPRNKNLLVSGIVEDTENMAVLLNMLFSRNDLVAQIYENDIDYKPAPKATKFEIIDYIMENEPKFVQKIVKNNILAKLNDEVAKKRELIYSYYFSEEHQN